MNYILNIHTSSEKAIVNICNESSILSSEINTEAREHAAFLHVAIKRQLENSHIHLNELKSIGVSGGPGSYTGIRVGLATAKGLCFALNIPMMLFNSLELMAFSAKKDLIDLEKNSLLCPMIDARRMEVFTTVYDIDLNEVIKPAALIIDENTFEDLIKKYAIYYFGSGAEKFKQFHSSKNSNLKFLSSDISSESLALFAWNQFQRKEFGNLINSNPLYVKDFYTPAKNE